MRAKKVNQGLGALLVVAVMWMFAACSTSSPSPSPSVSAGSGVAPSKAEITAAIKTLTKPLVRSYALAPYKTIWVKSVEQDASGRWLATAELVPPGSASWWPTILVVAKDSDGWHFVSREADTTDHGLPPSPSSSPTTIQPQ
jgi:hypothetical protein